MKTEDVRMTEIALNPYLTLVLFSVPPSSRTTNVAPRSSTCDTFDWIAGASRGSLSQADGVSASRESIPLSVCRR